MASDASLEYRPCQYRCHRAPVESRCRPVVFDDHMISRKSLRHDADRRTARLTSAVADEIHRLRMDAGVSLRDVAALTGMHPSYLARVETGEVHASFPALVRIGLALGAELNIKFFSGVGPRLHDRFQAPMVEAVLRRLHPRWLARVEVPISGSVRGVADLVLDERTARMTIVGEAQSEFRGLEERIRWFAEKTEAISERLKRDGRPREVSRLLIIRSTVNTREMARRYAATLSAAYPASSTACSIPSPVRARGPAPASSGSASIAESPSCFDALHEVSSWVGSPDPGPISRRRPRRQTPNRHDPAWPATSRASRGPAP